jgi:tetratricopeptide (TPR) repeat protein
MESQHDQGDRSAGNPQPAEPRAFGSAVIQNAESKIEHGGDERSQADGNGRDAGSDRNRKGRGDHSGPRDGRGRTSRGPSRLWALLCAGAVGLVCGFAGAFASAHFFVSSKTGDLNSTSAGPGSSKGSDAGKESASGETTAATAKSDSRVREAQDAWAAAVKELHQSQAAEREARKSEEDTKAVLAFLRRTLLSAGRPGDASLNAAFWAGGSGKDVSLRKAVDQADSQVGGTFAERPAAEAFARKLLGFAYLSLGDPSRAVSQYERALALLEVISGTEQSEIAGCRNELAVAYRLAGRTTDAARLFDQSFDSPEKASALATTGATLLHQNKPAEAELSLRKCLAMSTRLLPDDWRTFDTQSLLGEALLDQKKFADAEPPLVSGYQGLKARADSIPPGERPRLAKAGERLVRLYESWGKNDEATRWRKQLELPTATKTSNGGKSAR